MSGKSPSEVLTNGRGTCLLAAGANHPITHININTDEREEWHVYSKRHAKA
jgi:hypothetical protein